MTNPDTDTDLHAQWRNHAVETPPAALDDAIRAAAHRAVHAKPSVPRARAPWPTWATFAAAASIGVIAIGVWQLQPRDVDETRGVTSDVPARPSAPAAAAAPHARAEGAIVAAPAIREELQSSKTADARRTQEMAKQEMDRQASPPVSEEKHPGAAAKKRDIATDIAPTPSKVVATDRKTDAVAAAPPEARKPSPFPANDAARVDNAASPGAPAQPAGAPATMPATAAGGSVAASTAAVPFSAPRPMLAQAARPPAPSMAAERSAESGIASPAPRDKIRSIADYVDTLRRERAEQRESDARMTLGAMRAEYADADARLPGDLRAWAAQVAPLRK